MPNAGHWPSCSPPDRPVTHPPSITSWAAFAFLDGEDGPAPGRTWSWPIRRTPPARSASTDRNRRTVIRLTVAKLPSGSVNKPVWLWWSGTGGATDDVDRCWQAFLRRFDVEHTFRLLEQTLGWTRPRLRDSEVADRWTWLILAAHAQLRLARPLARDLRPLWERPAEPNRLTPARVRRGFRNLWVKKGTPADAPKPTRPGPGRPLGSKNRQPATRYDVGRVLATGVSYARPAHHKQGTKPRRTGETTRPTPGRERRQVRLTAGRGDLSCVRPGGSRGVAGVRRCSYGESRTTSVAPGTVVVVPRVAGRVSCPDLRRESRRCEPTSSGIKPCPSAITA